MSSYCTYADLKAILDQMDENQLEQHITVFHDDAFYRVVELEITEDDHRILEAGSLVISTPCTEAFKS